MSPKEAKLVRLTRSVLCVLGCGLGASFGPADALTLDFAVTAAITARRAEPMTSYRLPIGPFADGQVATRLTEGALDQSAWRLTAPDATTLQLLQPLRDQITAAGFALIYECEAAACGGFDFRYATDVLPEPDMHVDLGDYRYLAAQRVGPAGPEFISLIVSRGAGQGFVQLTRIGAVAAPSADLTLSGKSAAVGLGVAAQALPLRDTGLSAVAMPGAAAPVLEDLGARLRTGGAQVLQDLAFPSGQSTLADGDFAALAELAGWLVTNPTAKVTLVGHTDASGGLEGNIALSRKRAESVRQRLLSQYTIAPERVSAEGIGYLAPRDSNLTEAGRKRNRRVEVMLTAE